MICLKMYPSPQFGDKAEVNLIIVFHIMFTLLQDITCVASDSDRFCAEYAT